jgi:hypothetical protein
VAASSVIGSYLAELGRRLPAPIVDELADGVEQTYLRFRSAGLSDEQAGGAALAEFGPADMVVASFVANSPARRISRLLLATGPLAGACWAAVLLTGKAWNWPVPSLGRAAFGTALVAVIGALMAAAAGQAYRPTARAATAGCLGLLVLDTVMLVTVPAAAGRPAWLFALAACASGTRIVLTLRCLPGMLASRASPSATLSCRRSK